MTSEDGKWSVNLSLLWQKRSCQQHIDMSKAANWNTRFQMQNMFREEKIRKKTRYSETTSSKIQRKVKPLQVKLKDLGKKYRVRWTNDTEEMIIRDVMINKTHKYLCWSVSDWSSC